MDLRDYQIALVDQIRDTLRDPSAQPLVVAPTGSGKTVLFTYMTARAAQRGHRVGIVLPRQELVRQTSAALGDLPHGIVRGGVPENPAQPVQVCSAHTLVRRLDRHQFDLLIIDEAHHATSRTWRAIHEHGAARIVGFTATPVRLDGTGLADAGYTDFIEGPTTAQLIADGWLCDADIYCPSTVDASGIPTRGGDYARNALEVITDKPQITGCAVDHYRRLAHGLPAIAFCVSVRHAEHVAESFRAAGYAAASIDGTKTDTERARLISDLATGALNVLCSCDLISEGVDVPVVSCGIFLRRTQSLGLWKQQIGRCLRTAPGKDRAILLDHVGNTARHGMHTTEYQWSLDSKRRTRRDDDTGPAIRVCGQCCRPHVAAPTCPHCGHIHPATEREIKQIEGELVKLEAALERQKIGRCRTYEDLLAIEHARGYKSGWAWHRWQARQRKAG